MEFDSKQKVLLAIYTEYQKDMPKMKDVIKAEVLGLERDVFKIALEKLENEGLITDIHFIRGGNSHIPNAVITDSVKMTNYGIEYVEEKLSIERTLTGEEKVKSILKSAVSWGWDQIKDIAARTLADMSKWVQEPQGSFLLHRKSTLFEC